jgi:hypothetical protein
MTVCWHENRENCGGGKDRELAFYGRCRSGKRWFWSAHIMMEPDHAHGWADSEAQAITEARTAVQQFADRRTEKICAFLSHGVAYDRLKELNKAKHPEPAAPDTATVEYLYAIVQIPKSN